MTHDAREGVPNETKRKETMLPKWFLTYSIVTLQAVSKVGDAFGPALATTRPLLLLAVNSNDLHVALTSALIPTKEMSGYAWFLVALARRLLEDPLFFSFGWAYREDALRFLKEKAPRVAVSSSSAESNVRRLSFMAVLLEPGAIVCTLAGVFRMDPKTFLLLNVLGTLARLAGIRGLSAMFPTQLAVIAGFVHDHRMELLGCAVTAVLILALFDKSNSKVKSKSSSWRFVTSSVQHSERPVGGAPQNPK